jgi:phosphatidylserine synthase
MLYYGFMNIATTNSDPEQSHARVTTGNRTVAGLLWLAAATLVYLISLWLLKHHTGWSPAARVAITLAPLLPGILYLRTLLKSFWQMDELQRRIQIEALGFALLGTVVVMTAMNIFTAEGIRLMNYPQSLGIGGVYMTMFILWSVGVSISTFRYR